MFEPTARTLRRRYGVSFIALLTLAAGFARAQAVEPTARQLYEMSTETGMPHLEYNLRYAVVREQRCLNPTDLSTAFWMLNDVSLQDCVLERNRQQADSADYALRCKGGHGTSGTAQWQLGLGRISGTLNVRLGGKNMTFYQRIEARPVGACTAP